MSDAAGAWRRISTRAAFCAAFADQTLVGPDLRFVIHSDGRMTGSAGGARLSGRWHWQDGCFCRRAWRDGEDLGTDCEIIETDGARMRYIRDKGRGEASVVTRA